MTDRRKLLIHLRRLSYVLEKTFRDGPDGTLEGKYAAEQSLYVHYACGFYLAGILAYLEGEDGSYSWNQQSPTQGDFDAFATANPTGGTFASRGITRSNLDALAQLRNAIVHHDGDLAQNRNQNSLAMVQAANFPGVVLNGTVAKLEEPFLDYVRISALAVRNYFGDA